MGIIDAPKTCYFTDYPTTNIMSAQDLVEYYVIMGKNRINIRISYHEPEELKEYLKEKKWILKGLIFNGIWHKEYITNQKALDELIESNSSIIPKTPKEKKDKLLSYIRKQQVYDGERVTIAFSRDKIRPICFWEYLFFKNEYEFFFYLDLLVNEGLVVSIPNSTAPAGTFANFTSVTAKGIEYLLRLNEGEFSTDCFIAMSFDTTMDTIYNNSIKPAVEECGFKPIRIDKKHLDSDTTINDGIIASLKKSRFTIADFTDNKNGVYFEAGFALGRGQKVIYCCKDTDVEKLHFDIRAYQQIIWKDAADFKKKLIDKIEAFIL